MIVVQAAAPWYSHIPTVVQTIFWVILATIGVLTFLQARKTVLQPLRTEVFKLQLESMRELLHYVVGKDETTLRGEFGYSELFEANVVMMLDAYAESEFGYKTTDPDSRPYGREHISMLAVHPDAIQLASEHLTPVPSDDDVVAAKPSWSERKQLVMALPPPFVAAQKRLDDFLADPLMPSECAKLIQALSDQMTEDMEALRAVLEERSPEVPTKYPDMPTLAKAEFGWLHNEWNRRIGSLKVRTDEIATFARTYLGSDRFGLSKTPRK